MSDTGKVRTQYPNFDVLRLLAASAVLFSHSFAITEGTEDREPLHRLLGPGNLVALYGVFTFFIISGFLLTTSYRHRSSPGTFLARRGLRIFPGLALCVVVSVFVLGPALTSLTTANYLHSDSILAYAVRTLALVDTSDQGLPGVAFSTNDYGGIVNGSLWTLGPEFLCYLGVVVLGALRLLKLPVVLVVLGFGLWSHEHGSSGYLGNVEYLLPFFAAGSVLCFVLPHLRQRWLIALYSLVCLVMFGAFDYPWLGFALFGSVLVLLVGTAQRFVLRGATRFGDLSYGIYLYGWPVEETVRRALGSQATWWEVLVISLVVAALLALFSWHVVEARAIRLGQRLTKTAI